MEILYDFKRYPAPRSGVFQITTDEYGPDGWVLKEEVYTIIGETDDIFVSRLEESGHGEWIGEEVVQREYILPIGIHKSRLVTWLPHVQLSLFD
jgi:hypothetical protein